MTFKDLQRLIGSQSDANHSSNNPKQNIIVKTKRQTFLDMGFYHLIRKRLEYVEVIAASIISSDFLEKTG